MKTVFTFVVALFLSTLVSCSEEEEPRSPIIGTWEERNYSSFSDIWFVNNYNFKNDSIFNLVATVRETENGEDLGYRYITTGKYSVEGNIFHYYYSDALIYFKGSSETIYGKKEDLKPGIMDFFRVPKGEITFADDFSKFTFQENCWQMSDSEDCMEFPLQTFIRVD
ncbi:hypothetical protein [Algoriphagus pacificus]|uniref:Lipocalin-like domain-containing protein n=1 Tax=Algoriphagus pacificus TaxID=2811234 RepID=A0ABS3CFI6_9BACT|nr:hypothetical protein [Algoriphagus pacificus]MBN7814975.1 hypothetical protein [Algoriphagus pacificus]